MCVLLPRLPPTAAPPKPGVVCACLPAVPLQLEEVQEIEGLDEEADLPLEELLARYGNYHLAAAGDGDGEESAGELAPSPARCG